MTQIMYAIFIMNIHLREPERFYDKVNEFTSELDNDFRTTVDCMKYIRSFNMCSTTLSHVSSRFGQLSSMSKAPRMDQTIETHMSE